MNAKNILIVDFDAESLIALSNLVYEEGFQAETATDGLAAYEKFKSGNFDLVMLEPMLPKLHGFELCKKIAGDPERRIPVIIVTAIYREPSCRGEALNVHGAAAFFTKPYNKEELRAKMLQLLVETKPQTPKKVAEPVAPKVHAPQPSAQASPPPVSSAPHGAGPTIEALLSAKHAPREPRPARTFADIEKELQEVVSGIVPTAKKREPVAPPKGPETHSVREEPRPAKTSREPRAGNTDIDVLLKDAIGGLAPMPKKRTPEVPLPEIRIAPAPKAAPPEPIVRPAPMAASPTKPARSEKFTVAPEIRQGISFAPAKPNNMAHAASKLAVEKQTVAFDIDRTLIEIDKIPLGVNKISPVDARVADKPRLSENKRGLFEEYAEPAKKKTNFVHIGAVACSVLIAASAIFFVLKSKKPGQPASGIAAAARQETQAEPASRDSSTKAYPDSQEAELKAEPKKIVVKSAEQQTSDIGAPIMTVQPSESAPVHIQDQPTQPSAAAVKEASPSAPPQPAAETAAKLQPKETQPPADQSQAAGAAHSEIKEGALVALNQVDSGPVLIKRVDPRYPALAMRSGVGGTVTVNALVSEKGDVLRTEILKGLRDGFGFEAAAETALRQWKFRPARKDGANVKVWKPYDINFKANPKSS